MCTIRCRAVKGRLPTCSWLCTAATGMRLLPELGADKLLGMAHITGGGIPGQPASHRTAGSRRDHRHIVLDRAGCLSKSSPEPAA